MPRYNDILSTKKGMRVRSTTTLTYSHQVSMPNKLQSVSHTPDIRTLCRRVTDELQSLLRLQLLSDNLVVVYDNLAYITCIRFNQLYTTNSKLDVI